MKIALTGASGFVGSALRASFPDHVVIDRKDSVAAIVKKLQGVDVVINLAGAPIIRRWSSAYKKTLIDSRILTTRQLVKAINKSDIKQFISTSAIGIYPDDTVCDESCTQVSKDFLGDLAKRWEAEAHKANKPTTILRFSVILGKDGGALQTMLTPFKFCMGGIIGNGKMMTSWIDLEDLVRLYHFVIDNKIEGTFNAASPNPVTNKVFTKALGKVLHRPTMLPVPEIALRMMYGEASTVLTGSKEIYPTALLEKGFTFDYPDIDAALAHQLGRKR